MLFFIALRNLAARLSGRVVVAAGVALTMLGTLPFALAGSDDLTVLLLVGQLLQGVGFAATTFPVLELALASLTHAEAPAASAAFSVVQRVGAPFGVAVIAVVLQNLLRGDGDGLQAFTTTFWWVVGFALVPLVLALLLPGRPTDVVRRRLSNRR